MNLLHGVYHCFQHYFSWIIMASAPTYALVEFFLLKLCTIGDYGENGE